MHDLDQVRLLSHYRIDIFVGSWKLIDDAGVLPALDACRLRLDVLDTKVPLGLATAHDPPCAVRAGAIGVLVPLAMDNLTSSSP
jgi:hypothetical protein